MTIRAIAKDLYDKGIAVIGSTAIDKIIQRDISRYKIGGVTAYAGITYRRHGIATKVVTNVANHDREIIRRLQTEQVVVCNGHTPQTTHFINYVNEENRRQKIPQRAAHIRRSQIRENLKGEGLVHLGPLHATDIDIRAIKLLNGINCFIVLDAQGLVRSLKNKTVYPSASKRLPEYLGISKVVKASVQEYESIIEFFQMDLLKLLRQFEISEFIVTAGHRGGFVQTLTGEEVPFAAYRVNFRQDPTGAGDVFLAAYVIDRVFNRRPVAEACKYAAKLATRQIEGNYIKPENLYLEDQKNRTF